MPYPPMIEYNAAVQNPLQAFHDAELKRGAVRTNNLGLPVVMSGGFALTYTITASGKKYAVRCFHRDIPAVENKYNAISNKLRALSSDHFVNFDFQNQGIRVNQATYPIVKMDWIEGAPLGVWLDQHVRDKAALAKAQSDLRAISAFLQREGVAHGDIQNGNVMMSPKGAKLIDYDGMFVPGMALGNGTELGHKHFQHPKRTANDFGSKMDRFSFIAVDLSLAALIEDSSLHSKFREGGETIIFNGNDFVDPQNSQIFKILFDNQNLRDAARNFAAVCSSELAVVPTPEDFLSARNIPAAQSKTEIRSTPKPAPATYIGPYPVIDALDFARAARHVGDKIEIIGRIVEVKQGLGRRGRGKEKPYIFINFGQWRGEIVKVSIWSEGFSKLTEKPNKGWTGRWVSVTGLLDPPFHSGRWNYTHLSITVHEDGQIRVIDEKQANYRLGKAVSPSSADTTETPKGMPKPQPKPAPAAGQIGKQPSVQKSSDRNTSTAGVQGRTSTSNTKILDQYRQAANGSPSQGPALPRSPFPSSSTNSGQILSNVVAVNSKSNEMSLSKWAMVVAAVLSFLALANSWKQNGSSSNATTHVVPLPSATSVSNDKQAFPIPPPSLKNAFTDLRINLPAQETELAVNKLVNSSSQAGDSRQADRELPTIEKRTVTLPANLLPKSPQGATREVHTPGIRELPALVEERTVSLPANLLPKPQKDVTQEAPTPSGVAPPLSIAPSSPTNLSTFIGGWAVSRAQCDQSSEAPLRITARRAEVDAGHCDFHSVTPAGPASWSVEATCIVEGRPNRIAITLTRVGDILNWSRNRVTTRYVRCEK